MSGLGELSGLVPGRRYRVTFDDADGYFGGWFEAVFVQLHTAVDRSGARYVTEAEFDTARMSGLETCGIVDVTNQPAPSTPARDEPDGGR